jgi:hypothetical protein
MSRWEAVRNRVATISEHPSLADDDFTGSGKAEE